jgi:hypothetical protein
LNIPLVCPLYSPLAFLCETVSFGNNLHRPGGDINTNVQVIVTDRVEQTQYDTYCTAQDYSSLPSINKLTDATTISTKPAIGQITTCAPRDHDRVALLVGVVFKGEDALL